MSLWDANDLVRRLKVRLNRPATDAAFTVTTTDDVYFDFLTEGQDRVQKLLGIYVPDAVWTVPTLLTSADGGLTYTFGNDTDGAAIFAFGHFKVYPDLASIPDSPLIDQLDYAVENTKLRMPNNTPRTFSAGPYCQFAAPSNVITATTQPVIPKFARPAMLSDAEVRCLRRMGLDWGTAEAQFQSDWIEVLAAIRTQSNGKGRTINRTNRQYGRYWS